MNKFNFSLLLLACLFVSSATAQEANENWYHLDAADGFNGISADKAYGDLLKDRSSRTVVVAIIDSGIDIEHEDLKDNIWINEDEIAGNGIDDDNNGYIDDVHGWNFIGGEDGQNVGPDTYEATRIYGKLKYKYEKANPALIKGDDKEEYELFKEVETVVTEAKEKAMANIGQMEAVEQTIMEGLDALQTIVGAGPLDEIEMDSFDLTEAPEAIGKRVLDQFMADSDAKTLPGVKTEIKEALNGDKKRYQDQLDYAYNPDFNSREIVGDNYDDPYEKGYGNNDVEGPDALHGTHVAGIVGAVRNNGLGMNGVASNVKLMSVRTVPDGDERDKDVANAIRYAVDNGASIINMSFGKGYGTHKEVVDEAVRYAAKKDVLLIHAAGNSSLDTDISNNFPNDKYEKKTGFFLFRIFKKKGNAKNWIEVGALNYKKDDNLVAPFSNYAKNNVDIFAPGMKIYATIPYDGYRYLQGTSMAAPVVAGMAATLRSYFPALTATQVKDIIMESGITHDIEVLKPGSKEDKVKFTDLSVTGKVANLYKAVQLAMKTKGKKKVKPMKGGRA